MPDPIFHSTRSASTDIIIQRYRVAHPLAALKTDKVCDQTLSVSGRLRFCQFLIGGYSVILGADPAIRAPSKRIFVAKSIKGALSIKDDAAGKKYWQSEYSPKQ